MTSKIERWRTFRRIRVGTWRRGPLLIRVCAMGWGWPKLKAGNYLKGSVIERGPWVALEPVFGLIEVSWQPYWNDKSELEAGQ